MKTSKCSQCGISSIFGKLLKKICIELQVHPGFKIWKRFTGEIVLSIPFLYNLPEEDNGVNEDRSPLTTKGESFILWVDFIFLHRQPYAPTPFPLRQFIYGSSNNFDREFWVQQRNIGVDPVNEFAEKLDKKLKEI